MTLISYLCDKFIKECDKDLSLVPLFEEFVTFCNKHLSTNSPVSIAFVERSFAVKLQSGQIFALHKCTESVESIESPAIPVLGGLNAATPNMNNSHYISI